MKFSINIHFQSVLLTLVAIFLAMIGGRIMYGLEYGVAQPMVQWVPKKKPNKEEKRKEALSSTETVMDPYYG
jgi:hypothetical protein